MQPAPVSEKFIFALVKRDSSSILISPVLSTILKLYPSILSNVRQENNNLTVRDKAFSTQNAFVTEHDVLSGLTFKQGYQIRRLEWFESLGRTTIPQLTLLSAPSPPPRFPSVIILWSCIS